MLAAINAWTFPADLSPAEQLAAAAGAGFDGIELTVAGEGALRFDSPLAECRALARRAQDLSLHIVSLATAEFWRTNYAAPDEATRRRAADLTLAMLDRAAALSARAILVLPAVVGEYAEPCPRVAYADALQRSLEALCRLRHEAESRGVSIAIENVWNRFLLSPVEAADFIDRVNSPYVGWYFDIGNVLAFGYPTDWIATLGARIVCVHVKDYDLGRPGLGGFCGLGQGSVDWPAVIAALRRVGYDGPLTYEGSEEPHHVCRLLRAIIDGRALPRQEHPR